MRPAFVCQVYVGAFIALAAIGGPGATAASAQEIDCGPIGDTLCGLLHLARDNWNELIDSRISLESISFVGEARDYDLLLLLAPHSENYLVEMDEAGEIVRRGTVAEELQESTELQDVVPEYLAQFIQLAPAARYVMRLHWADDYGEFQTTAVLLDSYPYIVDTILSSALLVEESSPCHHSKVKWVFGVTRGEFYLDLLQWQDDTGLRCAYVTRSWMSIGNVSFEISGPHRGSWSCTLDYAYAFTTPLARAKISSGDLTIEVDGIGSVVKGGGQCF